MTRKEFKELAKDIFDNAESKGFHEKKRDIETVIMLIIDEISELHTAYRKGNLFEQCDKPIDNFTYFEEETADIVIRLIDMSVEFGVDLDEIYPDFYTLYLSNISQVCYKLTENLINLEVKETTIKVVIEMIIQLSKDRGYDLWQSIKKKHEFNKTRPRLHGKKF